MTWRRILAGSPHAAHLPSVRQRVGTSSSSLCRQRACRAAHHRRLTKQNLWVNGLGFTPDGESVLFSGVREHVQALWRLSVSAAGRPERVAFGDQVAAFDVAYRPGRLVFERRSPDSNVMRLDVETRTATPLQFLQLDPRRPVAGVFPDGKQIALVSSRTGQVEIWVCDSTGGDPRAGSTPKPGGLGEGARWSPTAAASPSCL